MKKGWMNVDLLEVFKAFVLTRWGITYPCRINIFDEIAYSKSFFLMVLDIFENFLGNSTNLIGLKSISIESLSQTQIYVWVGGYRIRDWQVILPASFLIRFFPNENPSHTMKL